MFVRANDGSLVNLSLVGCIGVRPGYDKNAFYVYASIGGSDAQSAALTGETSEVMCKDYISRLYRELQVSGMTIDIP